MCRVLFAVGEGERIRPLVRALVGAAENDPYKEKRGKGRQHKDGWGYTLLSAGRLQHYRSGEPIFLDEEGVAGLIGKLGGFSVLLAHARAVSQGGRDLLNTQPFSFSSRRGFSFWLYHNGDINKAQLIELGGFEEDLTGVSDSYILGAYLCRKLKGTGKGELLRLYSPVMDATNTSLNTGLLFLLPGGSARAFLTAYSRPLYIMRAANWDYVRQIEVGDENLFALASSTLELYHRAPWKPVQNGTAFYLTIDAEKESFNVERLVMG
ncbi:class II glutamine amidotransferase [Thermococcus sp.]